MVKEFSFKNFDLLCFKDSKNSDSSSYSKFINRDDLFVCMSKNDFIERIKNISSEKLSYLNYWKENTQKYMIDIYEEIIDNHSYIESVINEGNYDIYLVRKKDTKINYLRESDLIIDCNRVLANVNIVAEFQASLFSDNFDDKLKSIESRSDRSLNRNFFSYDNFLSNPNLKLSGSKYQSKI